jgi:hypothetical protein
MEAENLAGEVANKPIIRKILDFTDDLVEGKKSALMPKDLRSQRRAVDKVTNFQSDAPTQQANQTIRDVLRRAEDEAFDAQGLGTEFVDLKRKFGDIADARRILDRSSAREKSGTLTELMKNVGIGGVGLGGYQSDNDALMAAALLTGAGRKIGHGGAARILDRLSKVNTPTAAPAINRLIQSQNPFSFE